MNSIKEQREALLKQLEILQVLCLHEGKHKFESTYEDGFWHDSYNCPECGKEWEV